MSRKLFTTEQDRQIAAEYDAGSSASVLCSKWGGCTVTIYKAIRRGGGTVRPVGGPGIGTVNSEGYRLVWIKSDDPLAEMRQRSGCVPEHRLVMARFLNRPLSKYETVHHINGDKTDNRIENLQLRQGKHGKGQQLQCLSCGSHNVGAVKL